MLVYTSHLCVYKVLYNKTVFKTKKVPFTLIINTTSPPTGFKQVANQSLTKVLKLDKEQTLQILNKYVLHSMNVCSMKIWMHCIHHVITVL